MSLTVLKDADAQKRDMLAIRERFFNELLEQWSHPPQPIDKIMGQEEFYLRPDFVSDRKDDPNTVMLKDVERGVLGVSVTPPGSEYPHKGIRLVYSIMQAGDWIRFGFLVQGDPKLVLQYQQHHDHLLIVESIWDRECDYQFRDGGGMLIEWRFKEPDFYTNEVVRERFRLIARHLHFRLGRSILSVFDEIPSPEVNDYVPSRTERTVFQDGSNDHDDSFGDPDSFAGVPAPQQQGRAYLSLNDLPSSPDPTDDLVS